MAGSRQALGARGEQAVASHYLDAGYELLSRNWRCSEGELDLVLVDRSKHLLVFCEVKTRRTDAFGSPLEAVTYAKRKRLRRLAALWLGSQPGSAVPSQGFASSRRSFDLRFDVAAVRVHAGRLDIEIVESAL
ncbi:MAG TPA: YraN family protein [Acidimicrobiales bacterium]|nr:YraN family protein [Acidimicrobiales bacterium]